MATIQLQTEGLFEMAANQHTSDIPCVSGWLTSYVEGDLTNIYSKDLLYLHGTRESIRAFGQKIIDSVGTDSLFTTNISEEAIKEHRRIEMRLKEPNCDHQNPGR